MDPNKSQPAPAPQNPAAVDAKKKMLEQLMKAIMNGGDTKNIHDSIQGIKSAMGAYKGFAKEWDGLHNTPAQSGAPSPTPATPPMPPSPAPTPMPPTPAPAADANPMPSMPKPAMQPPQAPKMPPILSQPKMPQGPGMGTGADIAGPMPSFMGGGKPAGF
jgi:hypothetical protein